ncbi:MAG: riboflavin synthase [Halobacteriaceae archaeon]
MFTGIIEATGEIIGAKAGGDGKRLRIETPFEVAHGQSISIDGTCLTVESQSEGEITAFLAQETRSKTTLDERDVGDQVNLERAMPADGRFDGHLVQGHVDTTTTIEAIDQVGEDWTFTFALPPDHEQYITPRGSIALDGVSLTVADLDQDESSFDVNIIPTTYQETTFKERDIGDHVNVEVDIIAKYVERLL